MTKAELNKKPKKTLIFLATIKRVYKKAIAEKKSKEQLVNALYKSYKHKKVSGAKKPTRKKSPLAIKWKDKTKTYQDKRGKIVTKKVSSIGKKKTTTRKRVSAIGKLKTYTFEVHIDDGRWVYINDDVVVRANTKIEARKKAKAKARKTFVKLYGEISKRAKTELW